MTRASDLARLMGAGGTLNAALSVDTISEKTSGSGVTIDSLNVKDGGIGGHQIGGRRNIIINGAMQVAQRGTSSTGLGASAGYFTLDRYRTTFSATAGRLTMTQTADGPSGFANCLKLDCTTADTSIGAGEYFILQQKFEGQDLQQLKKGTSDAEEFTVSFYVKGNASATYVVEMYDLDNARQVSKTFSVTTDWTRVTLTFPADTTGAFGDDNAASLQLGIWLHAGSNYSSGTLNSSAFAANTNANRAAGISSFFDSTDRTFFLTGLQMEVGSQATPFEHRSFGEELALCQRYLQRFEGVEGQGSNTDGTRFISANWNRTDHFTGHIFSPEMRSAPTIGFSSADDFNVYTAGSANTVSGVSLTGSGRTGAEVAFTTSATGTAGDAGFVRIFDHTNGFIEFRAEL